MAKRDDEMLLMAGIWRKLEPLTNAKRQRIMDYLMRRIAETSGDEPTNFPIES